MIRRPPRSTLFPYTTLFRSGRPGRAPERFLPLDITSLLLHVMSKGKKRSDRKSGSAGMPRPISYAVFCLKKKRGRLTILATALIDPGIRMEEVIFEEFKGTG